MLGEKLTEYIHKAAPELLNIRIEVDGHELVLREDDVVNAYLMQQSFLSENDRDMAVFNLPGDYKEVLFLVASAIGCYKAVGKKRVKEDDLVPGSTLVLYNGELVRFVEWKDEEDGRKMVLANEDKHKTRTTLSVGSLSEISLYSGSRTSPDVAGAKTKLPAIQNALKQVLGLKDDRQPQVAGSGSIIVTLPESSLLDALKLTKINDVPFFDIFPSVKWTSTGENRLGRDRKKRSPLFYFVGSMSAADDLLSTIDVGICHTIISNGSRMASDLSLIDSIKSNYKITRRFVIDRISNVDVIHSLDKASFKIWAWVPDDLDSADSDFRALETIEVPYPEGFDESMHKELLVCFSELRKLRFREESHSLKEVLISAYGLSNKLFQAPVTCDHLYSNTPWDVRKHLEDLSVKILSIKNQFSYPYPDTLERLQKLLAAATGAFSAYEAKYEKIRDEVRHGRSKFTSVIVKRSNQIDPLRVSLEKDLSTDLFEVVASPQHVGDSRKRIIWTFRSDMRKYAESVGKYRMIFIGYRWQVNEMKAIEKQYLDKLKSYSEREHRASLLGVSPDLVSEEEKTVDLPDYSLLLDQVGIEELLMTTSNFAHLGQQGGIEQGFRTTARQVLFAGGFTCFYELGHTIKVIDDEEESVKSVKVDDLRLGAKVIFLREERESIFEELVAYFGHKSEIVKMLNTVEIWRHALVDYKHSENLTLAELTSRLNRAGLNRIEATVDNWIKGRVICPFEDDYRSIDVIASVTNDERLSNTAKIKSAAKRVHAMRIRIGRYLAKRIVQSVSGGEVIEDPVLAKKLDQASAYAEVAKVTAVSPDTIEISQGLVNRLLSVEDF